MNMEENKKEELIKQLIMLDKIELEEIKDCIEQFIKMSNKTGKDTVFIRYVAFRHYKVTSFGSKDTTVGQALRGLSDSLSTFVFLKNTLNIPDDIFINYILSALEGSDKE